MNSEQTAQPTIAQLQIPQTSFNDVAVHASSLWDGFTHARDSDGLFRIWGAGGIELHDRMSRLAVLDAQLCNALYAVCEFGFPGVYTYEVTEALGNAVAQHLLATGDFPVDSVWQNTLGQLAQEFFMQGDVADMQRIQVVLMQMLSGKNGDQENASDFCVERGS